MAICTVAICSIAACNGGSPTEAVPPTVSPPATTQPVETPVAQTEAPGPSDTPQQSGLTIDPSKEPPLDAAALSIAVPDFLTAEQQDLYRRAHSLYEHLLGDSIEYSETFDMDVFPPSQYETVVIDDTTYLVSQGRYSNWLDFDAVVHSIFTDTFWAIHNNSNSGYLYHVEYNGKHCFLDTSIGGGYYYNKTIPDEFRLDEKTESKIAFTLVGHYNFLGDVEGETDEQEDERLQRGYDYTLEFPIKMVLSENGWKFDEFHTALIDENEPQ